MKKLNGRILIFCNICIIFPLSVYGQLILPGKCPDFPSKYDFSEQKFLGTWFEQERTLSLAQRIGKCWTTVAVRLKDKSLGLVIKFRPILFLGTEVSFILNLKRTPKLHKYTVGFSGIEFIPRASFQVLATDYYNWALEWVCTNKGKFHILLYKIVGRRPVLEKHWLDAARNATKSFGLNPKKMNPTNWGCTGSLIKSLNRDISQSISYGSDIII